MHHHHETRDSRGERGFLHFLRREKSQTAAKLDLIVGLFDELDHAGAASARVVLGR
jgi:hypothetical protein